MKRTNFIRKTSKNEIPKLRRKLTLIFNEYIRLRDARKGCISCVTGAVENAGHFRSVGSEPRPSLCFDERNVNGQCIRCNYTLGGNLEGYEKGLVRRYGKTVIEELDIKRSVKQNPWTRFEYEMMIKVYKEKLKELKAECGAKS